ncbi:glycosyltransferase family 2 protein [Flavobacterium okayamense]|uniref:Glycosyltransferase 2-like domain-containing protein n=1 Tax=Flavobacterium okayamense TaxID=2830782 RepID=A0ABN6I2P5_9FLAO|nr:glycosyltransferase [Flavobacterium okayamense]BCY28718.1 hypothetical protein KK2020170_15860 [Flavobacterium okayamense]
MHHQPLVTIVCLCYNHEEFVIEALDSVINQDYKNIELIIVDDFSSDNSVVLIEKWLINHPEVLFIKNSFNSGNTKSFNHALKKANGTYIIDLATDDRLLPNCISSQLKAFENSQFQDLAVVYANFNLIDKEGKITNVYFQENEFPQSGNVYEMVISRSVKLGSIATIYNTEVLKKVGGYDESLAYEDLDIWVRISRNYNFEYINEVLAEKREIQTSLSSQFLKKNNNQTKFLHQSTLKIFYKILELNSSKKENRLVINRMYFELHKFISAREWKLSFTLFQLIIKAYIKSI